jgi:lipopolysaccharide export system permease protein
MKITRKYLLAELSGPFLLGLGSFSLVVLLHRFSRVADLVIGRGVPLRLVGRLLLALFPPFLELTLPAAFLLAVLLGLGRLTTDSETAALATSGVGMRGVAGPVLLAGGIVFSAALLVGWHGIPWGYRETQRVLARIVAERTGAGATEHVFREITPDTLIYPDRVSADGQRMDGVFLSFRPAGDEPLLVFAREGHFAPAGRDGVVSLGLSDGTIHNDQPGKQVYRLASFREMTFRFPLEIPDSLGEDDPRGMTLPELYGKIAEGGGAARKAGYRYHFHKRLSLAVSCLSFGLLAVPLGMGQRARGKSSAFAVTMALILAYYVFLVAAGMMENRAPAGMVALFWAPNALGLSLAAWILWRSDRSLTILPGLPERILVRK